MNFYTNDVQEPYPVGPNYDVVGFQKLDLKILSKYSDEVSLFHIQAIVRIN